MAKLTVSISEEARRRIDQKASELGLTRSAYVEGLVAKDAEAEFERYLEEGYRATAAQSVEFAESALPLAREVMPGADSSW